MTKCPANEQFCKIWSSSSWNLEFFPKVKKDGCILPRLFVLVFPSVLSCMLPFSMSGCNFLEFIPVLPSTKIYQSNGKESG
jgi:hypothetical protein